jgi:hypothetical protein
MWERMEGLLEEVGSGGTLSAEAAISLQDQIFDIIRSSTETIFRATTASPPDTGLRYADFGEETRAHRSPGSLGSLNSSVNSPVDGTCRSEHPTRSNTGATASNGLESGVDLQVPGWIAILTTPDTVDHPGDILPDFSAFENWPANGL